MPAVCTFWQLPDEESKFLDYLISTGDVVAFDEMLNEFPEDVVAHPLNKFIATKSPEGLELGLSQLVEIKPEFMDNGLHHGYMGPSYLDNAVLGYRRGKIRDGRYLTQSNVCAEWICLDESKKVIIDKNPEFVKWGKKVMAWLRRHASEWVECNGYKYRATEAVKQAVENGELEVVLY